MDKKKILEKVFFCVSEIFGFVFVKKYITSKAKRQILLFHFKTRKVEDLILV